MAAVIVNLLWFALSLGVALESWRLGVGSFVAPGPGFVPFLASLIMGGLSVVSLITAFSERKTALTVFKVHDVIKIFLVNLVLVGSVLLWEKLGFLPVTSVLLIFLFRELKPLPWGKVLVATAVTMVFTWLVFVQFLGLRLPKGSLWKLFLN